MLPSIGAWYQWHEPSNTTSSDNHHMMSAHNMNELEESNPGISTNSMYNSSSSSRSSLHGLTFADSMRMMEPTVPQDNMNALSSLADIALGSETTPSSPVAPLSPFVSPNASPSHQMFASPLISSTTSPSSGSLPSLPSSSTPYYYYYSSSSSCATAPLATSAHPPPTNHIHQHCASKNAPSGRSNIQISLPTTPTSFRHAQPISVPNAEKESTYSCQICSATQTPKWRSLLKDSIRLRLCNACGIRENRMKHSAKNDHQIQTKARISHLTLQKNSPFYAFHVS